MTNGFRPPATLDLDGNDLPDVLSLYSTRLHVGFFRSWPPRSNEN